VYAVNQENKIVSHLDIVQSPVEQYVADADQTLKIPSWNIHGCNTHKADRDFNGNLCKYDLIVLFETWTKIDSDVSDLLSVSTTFCVRGKRRSRGDRQPGGIAVFVKNAISDLIISIKKTALGKFYLLVEFVQFNYQTASCDKSWW